MKLDKYYDRLTPKERFNLVIEAKCRGDDEEYENLLQSTPRKTLTMIDAKFVNKMEDSREIVLIFTLALMETVITIDKLDLAAVHLERYCQHCHKITEEKMVSDEKYEAFTGKLYGSLNEICDSFKKFCSLLNLEPDTLLGAHLKPAVPYFHKAQEILSNRSFLIPASIDEKEQKILDEFYEWSE